LSLTLFLVAAVSIPVSGKAQQDFAPLVQGTARIDCSFSPCFASVDSGIDGTIDSGMLERFKRLIDNVHERAARERKELVLSGIVGLNSPGGSVTAAMAIGRILRKERIPVVVPINGECYSACVLVFAGAVKRTNAGKLGIHRPYYEVSRQEVSAANVRESYQRMLQEIRSYFREMNVSEQLADAMLRIEPANVRLLDGDELVRYGLTEIDPIEQETRDLEEAQSWGLSRQEYIRRKSIAGQMCPSKYDFGDGDPDSQCYQTTMKTGQAPPNSVPQDELAFYRQMCIKVGKRGPEIEGCVRASYLERRRQ
jgi:ATP-dependent protease ClpP protease subunit